MIQNESDGKIVLTEGAIIECIRRTGHGLLDPDLLNAPLVYSDSGRHILADLHRQYIAIGRRNGFEMLVFTDTWRCNKDRVEKAGMFAKDLNGDCVRFLRGIIREYGEYSGRVYLGGLTGPKGNAYKPDEALSARDAASFHAYQVKALTAAGADFLFAATIPSLSEAAGIASAMSRTAIPYIISFVLNRSGLILDGTSLQKAIRSIDDSVSPAPIFYMANCCHPTFYETAMKNLLREDAAIKQRIIGLQANTSSRDASDLDGLAHLDSEDPVSFAESMIRLHMDFGTRILGGCCGTDDRHIDAIAEAYNKAYKRK